jgi:hypothetical protein
MRMRQRSAAVFAAWVGGVWVVVALCRGGIAWTPAFLTGLAFLWLTYSRGSWRENPGAFVFLAAATIYLSTFRWRGGDDQPATLLPIAILKHGTLTLDPVIDPWLTGKYKDFVIETGGHKLTLFSIVPGILALPVYLIPMVVNAPLSVQFLHNLSKLSASLITAASAAAFYLGIRSRCSPRWAMAVTAFYALNSFSFSVASQGLWEHGPAQLGLALGLLGYFNEADWLSGFGFALGVAARPDTALFATAAGLYLIARAPKRLPRFLAGAIVPLGALAIYWVHYTGKLEPPEMQFHAHVFKGINLEAFLGYLFSPTRGLLFFCPVAVFGVWGAMRRGLKDSAPWFLVSCLASLILVSSYGYWTAGMTFGPRYLSGAAIILVFFCADLEPVLRTRPRWLAAFAVAGAFSILVGALGAYLNWPGSFSYEVEEAQAWWMRLHPVVQIFRGEGGLGGLPVVLRALIGVVVVTATGWLAADLCVRLAQTD